MIDKLKTVLSRKLPPGSFVRNVVTLMTGTTFAQALMILVAPILTRLYSPEDFGVFALYISILGILAVVACWRYELAIVLPEKDEDAANLMVLSICICLGMAVLTLLLIALFRHPVANLLGAPGLAPWLWFMPLSLLAAGLFQALNYWSTRRKQFRRLAVRQITQSTVTAASQLASGLIIHAGAGGMIGGSILGQAIATTRLAWHVWKEDLCLLNSISISKLKEQANLYREFPIFQIWAAILNSLSAMTPILLLGYFFSPAIVGFYALGQRVIASPMGIIGGSVSQVFFPRAELARRQGNLDQLVVVTFRQLLSIGLFPIAVFAIIGPELIGFVFGEDWAMAGLFLRLLCPYLLFNFLSAPISSIFSVLRKQKDYLFFNITYFILAITALVIGGLNNNAQLAIGLFGAVTFVLYFYFGAKIFRISGVDFATAWSASSTVVLSAIAFIIPVLISHLFIYRDSITISLSLAFTFVYYLFTFNKKRDINEHTITRTKT